MVLNQTAAVEKKISVYPVMFLTHQDKEVYELVVEEYLYNQ